MKTFVALIAAYAAGLVWTTAHAQTTVKPVAGAEVGLEHDPSNEMVAKGTTDPEGSVTFSNLKPGRYRVVLTGKSKLTVPARITIAGRRRHRVSPSRLPRASTAARLTPLGRTANGF